MKMEDASAVWLLYVGGALLVLRFLLRNVNWFLYEYKLGGKQYFLPPGDMGWPLIGNMWSFLSAYKTSNPETFIDSFYSRYTTHCSSPFPFSFSPHACYPKSSSLLRSQS